MLIMTLVKILAFFFLADILFCGFSLMLAVAESQVSFQSSFAERTAIHNV